ncbi:MAG: lipid-A-disaccharide synthase N-terminal domain-containing protein [Phycisphaerae bacterium]
MLANWFFNDLFNWLGLFGLAGQFAFMMRFVVQWLASERRGRSYVPIAFWYLSLCGGAMLFSYALMRRDPVIMLGQALGIFIYVRNLVLIYRRRFRYRRRRILAEQAAASSETLDEVAAVGTVEN